MLVRFLARSEGSVVAAFEISFLREFARTELEQLVRGAFDAGLASSREDVARLGEITVQPSSLKLNGQLNLDSRDLWDFL